jgi:hypothetical protein
MNTTENLRFDSAKFKFSDKGVDVEVYPREETERCMSFHNCLLLAPRLAGIFRGTNFQFAQPNVLCGGASHS